MDWGKAISPLRVRASDDWSPLSLWRQGSHGRSAQLELGSWHVCRVVGSGEPASLSPERAASSLGGFSLVRSGGRGVADSGRDREGSLLLRVRPSRNWRGCCGWAPTECRPGRVQKVRLGKWQGHGEGIAAFRSGA